MPKTETPPPGAVFDLAERAVEYVRNALKVTLDYEPETLPVLDHWAALMPREGDAVLAGAPLAELAAATAGAYFGEVARRALGGHWRAPADADPRSWTVTLTGGVSFAPVGFAAEVHARGDAPGCDGNLEIPAAWRDAVERALDAKDQVPLEEYYSFSGRLETLTYVVELVVAMTAQAAEPADAAKPAP